MPIANRPGEVLADRYLLVDLLSESGDGRFWRAHDRTLDRHVAIHVIAADDDRADGLLTAARQSATVSDRRVLRVLDVDRREDVCYVVNEWGTGTSLDILVAGEGPVPARRAAWIVSEVASTVATAHEAGVTHGRLVPENVLIDQAGSVRVIGLSVEAALLGLPSGRRTTDVTDLAALLYFLLTGAWAGVSRSAVPTAPSENGRVLRPRQVKAGVPRVLDALCDRVINPFGANGTGLPDAREICEQLREFVGDPTGLAEAGRASRPSIPLPGPDITQPIAAVPPVAPEPEPEPEPSPEPEPEPEPPSDVDPETTATPRTDLPTQAGMPIFDDENDEVAWLTARAEVPPPPPPFEDPPERPLFAPEPEGGAPVRRPRPGTGQPASGDYWPWETTGGGRAMTSTGSGIFAVPAHDDLDDDEEVPGRSWLRLAAAIAASLLLLLAVVFAFNLGRGRSAFEGIVGNDDPASPSPSASRSESAAAAEPITGVTASDFDPQGDPPEEYPELAPLAVDGDPATGWETSTYQQQLGPGGLKTGVGLVLDLGSAVAVTEVDLTLGGEPSGVSLYVSESQPRAVAGLTPVAEVADAGEQETLTLDEPATGQYLIVWFTSLPQVDGGWQGVVNEVVVRGTSE